MDLKPGTRLRSQVDTTQIIVVRRPRSELTITCGGFPMIDLSAQPQTGLVIASGHDAGTELGKRYTHPAGDDLIEVLVTQSGPGTLAVDGVVLTRKEAQPLPASD